MDRGLAGQIARWVALGALFLIPLAPLLVANSYFFPFISGKAFYVRILVEIAFAAWAVLALMDRAYRPRFSWIGATVVAFVAWMFVADAVALNASKAFWSNFERMEGWVLLIHLLGFFFAAGAVLRVERKWRAWFLTSLGIGVVVSGYALLQLAGQAAIHQGSTRIDASFGNSAYLAIYLLFNTFIALWLALTEEYAWLKWTLLAFALLETVLIFFTETRGTVLGLVAALLVASLLTALTSGKRARRGALWAFVLIMVASGGFFLARDSAFVQGNHILQRIASISVADGQTRFTLWHMAFQGVAERPIVGWGQEGFNYIFNAYYDPSLYAQEPWFDRAHNAFIDWLTAGGIPAFLLYLGLFGSAFVLLWRSSELSRPERIALTGALIGYAVHNLFVFDNLYSYVYFFAILALIDSQIGRPLPSVERVPELSAGDGATYALPIATACAIVLVWTVNLSGMRVARGLITALTPSQSGVDDNIARFTALAQSPSFAAQEVREQLVSFAASVVQSPGTTEAQKQQAMSLAVTEMGKQVAAYPLDAREQLQLAYAYRTGGDLENALAHARAALALSPNKELMLTQVGTTEWDAGNVKAAQADLHKAYELGPQFPELAAYAAAGDLAVGDRAAANALLMKVYGTTTVDSDVLAVAYYRTKDWQSLINLWKLRTTKANATAQTWFSLAAAYYTAGDFTNASRTITQAIAKYPDAAASGAAALKQIEAKTVAP